MYGNYARKNYTGESMTREQIEEATQRYLSEGKEIKYFAEKKVYSNKDILDFLERISEQVAFSMPSKKRTKKLQGTKK